MPQSTSILDGLNPAQREAVTTIEGPLLVIAGAGSGKTRVITTRVAHLAASGVEPWRILAVTFTNKAAREMATRVDSIIGPNDAWISTFHAFGVRFLRGEAHRFGRTPSFTLYDRGDSESVVKATLDELNLDKSSYPPGQIMEAISKQKSRLVTPEEAIETAVSGYEEEIARIYRSYEQRLERSGAFDFDDLLQKTVELLETAPEVLSHINSRFRYVMVDEYQDVNLAQYRLVRLLAGEEENLCVTGDPDQCIYAWRGSDIDYILAFTENFPKAKVVKLEQNYRSVNTVLRAASAIIRYNSRHGDKELWSEHPDGEPIIIRRVADEIDEARAVAERILQLVGEGVPRSDIAVFYRLNSLSLAVERMLMTSGIPYQVFRGLEFFKRKEVKDTLAWLRFVENRDDEVSLRRIINVPPRGIGDKTVAILFDAARDAGLSTGALLDREELWRGLLNARALKAVSAFTKLLEEIRSGDTARVDAFIVDVVERTGLETFVRARKDSGGADPWGNVEQLIAFAHDHRRSRDEPSLGTFLEEVALYSDVDAYDQEAEKVALMTVHSAKGLEFPHVVMVGMDAELFPHAGMFGAGDEEEERRLFYVGLTRAERSVMLLTTDRRTRFGRTAPSRPSIFLTEIPAELTVVHDDVAGGYAGDVEQRLEYEIDESMQVKKGARVRHPSFGEGTVTRVSGRGGDARITIDFPDGETRRFILKYAGLEPADPAW